jgi:uncharacterized membrane protein
MWLGAIKLALNAGTHIYKKKQETKMLDEAVLIILSMPIVVLAWAVISDDPTAMDKVKLFFDMFSQLPSWFTNLWILVVASIYGIKGTQIFRGGMDKTEDKK